MPPLAALFLFAPLALSVPLVPAPAERLVQTTQRSADAFGDCFIASQAKAQRPWAYVPGGDSGGTFSTLPGADGLSPYYLSVRESGGLRRLALSGEAPAGGGETIAAAVDGCLT